ncbi:hypothetical protein P67b_00017 [Ruegeria phage Tedan]|nr:hypothetical protein P67b_00017 [Ruegeria phage Tedan]
MKAIASASVAPVSQESEAAMTVVKLTRGGVSRVMNGEEGMTFLVHEFTDSITDGKLSVAHIRDYRYAVQPLGFQIWSLPAHAFEVISE